MLFAIPHYVCTRTRNCNSFIFSPVVLQYMNLPLGLVSCEWNWTAFSLGLLHFMLQRPYLYMLLKTQIHIIFKGIYFTVEWNQCLIGCISMTLPDNAKLLSKVDIQEQWMRIPIVPYFVQYLVFLLLNFASLTDMKCYLSMLMLKLHIFWCEVESQIYGLWI